LIPGISSRDKDIEDPRLSLRERNKLRTQKMLEEAMATTASASGTATPQQQATASASPGGIPPLAPMRATEIGFPGLDTNLYNTVADRIIGDMNPNNQAGGVERDAIARGEVPPGRGGSDIPTSGRLNPSQIAQVAAQNTGWRGDDLVKAVAVAMAESGGNPTVAGDVNLSTPGEKSIGLWQINFRPQRDANNAIRDPQRNANPVTNAQNAYKIYQQQGWRAWSVTHGTPQTNSNHYSRFLPEARRAVQGLTR
jgi:hypothetical protein